MRDAGLSFTQAGMALDSALGGGYPIAEFAVAASPTAVALVHLAATWVKARAGRRVRVEVGDVTVEADSEN